jgi:hypothetical protein
VHSLNLPRRAEVRLHPDSISLTIVGAQSLINQVNTDSIKVTVDCTGVSRGDTAILAVRVDLPIGIRLVKAEPDSVEALIK